MGKKKTLFKSEESKSRAEVAAFLRELANYIESGKAILKRGEEEVELSLPENLILEVKAVTKTKPGKTKQSLEIEIEWREGISEEAVSEDKSPETESQEAETTEAEISEAETQEREEKEEIFSL